VHGSTSSQPAVNKSFAIFRLFHPEFIADSLPHACIREELAEKVDMDLDQTLGLTSVLIPVLGTFVVAIVTAAFGLRNYRQQREIDRKVELRNRRAKEYERYLTAYADVRRWDGVDDDKHEAANLKYYRAYHNLFQVASDPVLKAATEFHNSVAWGGEPHEAGEEYGKRFKKLYGRMILAMRKDAFEATEIPEAVIVERLPWYFEESTKGA
jgi:hypothetical protein